MGRVRGEGRGHRSGASVVGAQQDAGHPFPTQFFQKHLEDDRVLRAKEAGQCSAPSPTERAWAGPAAGAGGVEDARKAGTGRFLPSQMVVL